jgi:hypothetical protein
MARQSAGKGNGKMKTKLLSYCLNALKGKTKW